MSYLNLCKDTPRVHAKFADAWRCDNKKLKYLMLNSKKYLQENPISGVSKVRAVETSIEDLDCHIEPQQLNSNDSLVVFIWDSVTPFFAPESDQFFPSLKMVKERCRIHNKEAIDLESISKRSENPYNSHFGPKVSDESKYWLPGNFYHYSNRRKAHVGFMIDSLNHGAPIENNRPRQKILENFLDKSKIDGKLSERYGKGLINDTLFKRVENCGKALAKLFAQLLAYQKEKPLDRYHGVYIIINPIQGLDCSYVSAITQFIKYYIISEYKRLNDDNEWKDCLPYLKLICLSNCGPVSSHGLYSPKREFRGEASKAVSSYIYKVYVYFL